MFFALSFCPLSPNLEGLGTMWCCSYIELQIRQGRFRALPAKSFRNRDRSSWKTVLSNTMQSSWHWVLTWSQVLLEHGELRVHSVMRLFGQLLKHERNKESISCYALRWLEYENAVSHVQVFSARNALFETNYAETCTEKMETTNECLSGPQQIANVTDFLSKFFSSIFSSISP